MSAPRLSNLTRLGLTLCVSLCLLAGATAQEKFSDLVGPVATGAVDSSSTLSVPYITWGGDVATFHANGGLSTRPGTIFADQGLSLQLTAGDDFIGQVKDYVSGKTPFLRGTMRMLGQASEVLGKDPRTKPVVVLQLSWSLGDHIVGREDIKSLNDLKGKRIACQQGGPHVGLLYDSLNAAQLTKDDVEIVWTTDLTGPDGAAEKFRTDQSIDACCVITPDMIGLTGGFDSVGSGAEGTVRGARIVNSTQTMSRSIADVYAVRKDWFDANRETVQKFVAGYLKATEDVVEMRKNFESTQRLQNNYRELLTQAQQIFGEDVIPDIEVDGHGLLLDCAFVGLPGQIAFFDEPGNLNGFDPKLTKALDLAETWGYADRRYGFDPAGFDYRKIATLAGIDYVKPDRSQERIAADAEGFDSFIGGDLDDSTIVSFTISFEPNQTQFPADRYGSDFDRALEAASTFGNARLVIMGHSDPTKTLVDMIKSGIKKGLIRQQGSRGNYQYFLKGKKLDFNQTKELQNLIDQGMFGGGDPDPRLTMQAALTLSNKRAEAVSAALLKYGADRGVTVDRSQITPAGAGISDPVIPKPGNASEARKNMRVEFRIVKVDAETLQEEDFDF